LEIGEMEDGKEKDGGKGDERKEDGKKRDGDRRGINRRPDRLFCPRPDSMSPANSPRCGQLKYAERHLKFFALKKSPKKTQILKKSCKINFFMLGWQSD
jgi:hypothetical protein